MCPSSLFAYIRFLFASSEFVFVFAQVCLSSYFNQIILLALALKYAQSKIQSLKCTQSKYSRQKRISKNSFIRTWYQVWHKILLNSFISFFSLRLQSIQLSEIAGKYWISKISYFDDAICWMWMVRNSHWEYYKTVWKVCLIWAMSWL